METKNEQKQKFSREEAPMEGWLIPTTFLTGLLVGTMRMVYESDYKAYCIARSIRGCFAYQCDCASAMADDDPNKRLALFFYPKIAELFDDVARIFEGNLSDDVLAMCGEHPSLLDDVRKYLEKENDKE